MRTQTVALASYACDTNHSHAACTAASTGHQYMEVHHIIPLKSQERFSSSFDVYANLNTSCPICQRKIHLGIKEERRLMIDGIYENRKDRLAKCGFVFGKEEFEDLVLGV